MNLETVLMDLYNDELNVNISSFYDTNWQIDFGDAINGFEHKTLYCRTYELASCLIEGACRYYPNSDFAKKYSM